MGQARAGFVVDFTTKILADSGGDVDRTPPTVRTPAPVRGAHPREARARLGHGEAISDGRAEAGVIEVAT